MSISITNNEYIYNRTQLASPGAHQEAAASRVAKS